MVTSATWQFPHIFWNGGTIGASYGQHFGHLGKKKCSNEKVNENEHTHTHNYT
jgi:hypothetical protein